MSGKKTEGIGFYGASPVPANDVLVCFAIGEAAMKTRCGESVTIRVQRDRKGVLEWVIVP